MKLINIRVKNYRSIIDSQKIRIEALEIIVGQGVSSESDILEAISVFFAQGSGLISAADFRDKAQPICLCATFTCLNDKQKIDLKRYLINDTLYLEKIIRFDQDKLSCEYFGYLPEPQNWWLSLEKIYQRYPDKQIPWEKIAYQNQIVESVREYNVVTETSYITGLEKLIAEQSTEFDLPQPGELKSLGLYPELLKSLPDFIFIPSFLLNSSQEADSNTEKAFIQAIEYFLHRLIISQQMFFTQESKSLKAAGFIDKTESAELRRAKQTAEFYLSIIEELSLILSNKVSQVLSETLIVKISPKNEQYSEQLKISVPGFDDMDLMQCGYDFKKAILFGLLDIMVQIKAGKYLETRRKKQPQSKPFILGINKPELFFCSQTGKKFFSILRLIADFEQTIIMTNCPNFVDIAQYESILLIKKQSFGAPFNFVQTDSEVLTGFDRQSFNLNKELTAMNSMLFFAQKIIITENQKQLVALLQAARNCGIIKYCLEEIGCSVFSAGTREQANFFIKLLNGFNIKYTILIESGDNFSSEENIKLNNLAEGNRFVRINSKLEELLGMVTENKQLYDFNRFLLSCSHPSEEFRNILDDVLEISKQKKEVFYV